MSTRVFFSTVRQNDFAESLDLAVFGIILASEQDRGDNSAVPKKAKHMAQLPKSTTTAITLSVNAMLTPLAIPQATIDGALSAMFAELNGTGTRSITNGQPLDRVLSAAQVAALLGRSRKTVTELAKRGKIRAVKIGANGQRASGYSEDSVRELILNS